MSFLIHKQVTLFPYILSALWSLNELMCVSVLHETLQCWSLTEDIVCKVSSWGIMKYEGRMWSSVESTNSEHVTPEDLSLRPHSWQCQEMGIPVLFKVRWDVLPTEANLYCKYCSMLAEPDVTSSGQASFSCNPTRDMIKWASQSPEETSSRSAASEFTAWLAWGLLWTLCYHSSDNVIHKLHPFHFYPWVNSIPQFIEQIAINLLIKQAQTRNSGKTWTPGTQSSCVRFTKHTLAHMGKSSQKAKQLLMNLRALASQDLEPTLLTSPRLLCGGGCTHL